MRSQNVLIVSVANRRGQYKSMMLVYFVLDLVYICTCTGSCKERLNVETREKPFFFTSAREIPKHIVLESNLRYRPK